MDRTQVFARKNGAILFVNIISVIVTDDGPSLCVSVMVMLTVFITWMYMDIKYMTKWAFMVQCLISWPTNQAGL